MHRVKRAVAAMAVLITAVTVPVANVPAERPTRPGAGAVTDWQRVGEAPDVKTSLIVLCFPGAGCIVCHNGYCEYTGGPW